MSIYRQFFDSAIAAGHDIVVCDDGSLCVMRQPHRNGEERILATGERIDAYVAERDAMEEAALRKFDKEPSDIEQFNIACHCND